MRGEGDMKLWYKKGNNMVLFDTFGKIEEILEVVNNLPSDFFQVTSKDHNRILNGFKIGNEVFWRLEGSHVPLYPTKY